MSRTATHISTKGSIVYRKGPGSYAEFFGTRGNRWRLSCMKNSDLSDPESFRPI